MKNIEYFTFVSRSSFLFVLFVGLPIYVRAFYGYLLGGEESIWDIIGSGDLMLVAFTLSINSIISELNFREDSSQARMLRRTFIRGVAILLVIFTGALYGLLESVNTANLNPVFVAQVSIVSVFLAIVVGLLSSYPLLFYKPSDKK